MVGGSTEYVKRGRDILRSMAAPGALRVTVVAIAASLPSAAGAQDLATADALFRRGVAAMQAGDLETACPSIAESQRLDPRPGTLFTLAECTAKRGALATASVHYGDYLAAIEHLAPDQRAKHEERRKITVAKLAELSPRVPKLTVTLPASAPAGTTVRRDGVELGAVSLGVALPVDPGERTLVVRTPDGRERETRITLAPGETKAVELALPTPAVATATGSASPTPAQPKASSPPRNDTPAYVVGGVGVAALAVGAVTGALVFSKKSVVDAHCADTVCDAEGKRAADSAKTLGLVSTIGVGVGVAALATSAVLLLSGKREPAAAWRVTPTVSPRGGGVAGEVRW